MQTSFLKITAATAALCFSTFVLAQQTYSVSGTIKDKKNGELLIGVAVKVSEDPSINVVANEYGFYSLSLPEGNYTLIISNPGYKDFEQQIKVDQNIKMDLPLLPQEQISKSIDEVVITGIKKDKNLTSAQMGTETLSIKNIEKLPVLFGEKDVMKTIQLLPGIKSNGEGSSGFSVRGGATDQNLILLDEAPVYNASHLLGFFSTFNSDALKDVSIIKGNSPAQYGGRLSSVLDVKMKDGNNQDYNINGGVGLISSRLSVEGPIQKEKSSFIVSGRRTYADLFLKTSNDYKDNKLYFYDLNLKANYQLNENNRLYLSGYFGRDVLGLGNTFSTDWGNTTATLRWNSIINSKLFSNTSFIYSNYDYKVSLKSNDNNFGLNSKIQDWNLKQDFTWFAGNKHSVRFGLQSIYHTITPSSASGTSVSSFPRNTRKSWENALYINDDFKATEKLTVNYGARLSMFSVLGGDTFNTYNNGVLTDSRYIEKGKFGKTYVNIEPRITANYRINEVSSIKAGYSRNTQNLHLLSNSSSGNPTDQWIGSSLTVKPEIADQVSLGFSRNFNNNNYEVNAEVYYKSMQNQIDFKNGAQITFDTAADVESELLFGKGRAYGLELIAKKKSGKLTGWISYTLSKTERKINGINDNQWYNARMDKTHDLSIVATYQLNPKWSFSGLFVYSTGNAVTFPTGKYQLNGQTVFQYSTRNADRMPAYHRMDLSATYEPSSNKRFRGSWTFGIYNLYGRENAYTITFEDNPNNPGTTRAMQTSLFRWVPNITYNFKF
ncbi:TonB-dependent receptor [Chryseobacterium indologenes]|uniref:TonB-dependent receptor n=1 Tax=Chryseobacterium indologenes TaxID=253 RepID=UPI000F4E680D|nr:TonB-dependent receptor [Chryseobacterium indologenes]AYZ36345.1 TonB-dependent receptor [Chryseobacterium indologenes]MBF6645002.1 TonB-dependent receptor [Chryseobacterium indologenes]MBU3047915.1 TonB-dependent receptor [Chryseobacterium indologenes]MEB4759278.1 TonB-dependent receptor [Chryseobacterium indologenes]QQQ71320.1 TonB-dependent receptor [Chryseobacterium indologenes]